MRLQTKLAFIVSIFLLLLNQNTFAQYAKVYPDAGLWTTFSIDKKINKKFSVSLDQEFRMKENFSKINLFYTNLGATYKFSKTLKASLIYRITQKGNDDNTYGTKHRLMLDVVYKQKLSDKFDFSFRERFQIENNNIYSSKDGKYLETFLRSKAQISYDLTKRISPYFSEEIRVQLHDPRNPESDYGLHRFRTCLGIDYALNKKNKCGIYYLMQHEINVYKPNELYIVGLEYGISL